MSNQIFKTTKHKRLLAKKARKAQRRNAKRLAAGKQVKRYLVKVG
ncbi:hypothetical protein [Marinifaba aquimaris]|nr:hypothetical protein [Marinifaba aquimaris]